MWKEKNNPWHPGANLGIPIALFGPNENWKTSDLDVLLFSKQLRRILTSNKAGLQLWWIKTKTVLQAWTQAKQTSCKLLNIPYFRLMSDCCFFTNYNFNLFFPPSK